MWNLRIYILLQIFYTSTSVNIHRNIIWKVHTEARLRNDILFTKFSIKIIYNFEFNPRFLLCPIKFLGLCNHRNLNFTETEIIFIKDITNRSYIVLSCKGYRIEYIFPLNEFSVQWKFTKIIIKFFRNIEKLDKTANMEIFYMWHFKRCHSHLT